MIEPETQRIQAMAKRKSPVPGFIKYAGSIQGSVDLSSRRGGSRVVVDRIVEEKAEAKPPTKSLRRLPLRSAE
jgi:hypothetical protein